MSLVHVHTANTPMEALLLGGLLQSEGIDVHLPGEEGGLEGPSVRRTQVFVPREQVERARTVILEFEPLPRAPDPGDAPPTGAPSTPEPEPRPVLVHRADAGTSAILLAGLLCSEGLSAWAPCARDPLLPPVVFVLEPQAPRAREVLAVWLEAMGRPAGDSPSP